MIGWIQPALTFPQFWVQNKVPQKDEEKTDFDVKIQI